MALINCLDCNTEISTNAPTCSSCGAVQQPLTILETSKRLKRHTLGSVLMLIVGALGVTAAQTLQGDVETLMKVSGWVIIVGLIWYFMAPNISSSPYRSSSLR